MKTITIKIPGMPDDWKERGQRWFDDNHPSLDTPFPMPYLKLTGQRSLGYLHGYTYEVSDEDYAKLVAVGVIE